MRPEFRRCCAIVSVVAAMSVMLRGGELAGAEVAERAGTHWAFSPPERPRVPLRSGWARSPIDAFLAEEHAKRGLEPLPPAPKHVLLRRVYLDLVGLPPPRHELEAFLADPREDAYREVVDRLLASPAYGERWGRHWMDVWRYSDWYGRRSVPDVLNSYGQVFRWRDWIVRSLNQDKGYDRMVMEMLAADELFPADDENVVATGFIVRNFYRWNYNTWMKDNVEHTAKAFLGITLNCCHCHDHKYDPVTQEEYFRFRAFFEPIEIRQDRVAGEPDPGPYPKYSYGSSYKPITSGLVRIVDEKLDAETFMYAGGESRNVIAGKPAVKPGVPRVLGGAPLEVARIELPPTAWYPGLKPFVQREETARREGEVSAARATLQKAEALVAAAAKRLGEVTTGADSAVSGGPAEQASQAAFARAEAELQAARMTLRVDQAGLSRAQAELEAVRARIRADAIRFLGVAGDPEEATRAAARAERAAALESARHEHARAERAVAAARHQAAQDKSGEAERAKADSRLASAAAAVQAAETALKQQDSTYTPFSPQYPRHSSGRRAALARWIADRDNPLTARVAVNHIWMRHFGSPFVATTDNLGRNGARPTHPALLDWLAVELMENDWSMKHIHRLIVNSTAYKMRSYPGASHQGNLTRDRDNSYLWRFNAARMEAEVVRDSILHVAGELDRRLGGKEIDQNLGLSVPRRSIYFEHHGEGRMQFLELFDAANPCDCYRRTTSVRPQQALALANSALAVRQARLLVRKLEQAMAGGSEPGGESSHDRFVIAGFQQVLARPPSAAELAASREFLENLLRLYENASEEQLAAASQQGPVPASTRPITRARECMVQALFSHHDFLTIH